MFLRLDIAQILPHGPEIWQYASKIDPIRLGCNQFSANIQLKLGHNTTHRPIHQPQNPTIELLEAAYIEAATELQIKQADLCNYAQELDVFVNLRDTLKEHPEFSGQLPKTYYSGGSLDPEGIERAAEWPVDPRP